MEEIPQLNLDLYELHKEVIEREVNKRRGKWQLDSLHFVTWDDIRQVLLLHVVRKIHLWKPEIKPLPNYLHGLLGNRIKNIIRDYYGNAQNPCVRCVHNTGGERCAVFKTQNNSSCSLFSKWNISKRYKLEIAFALSQDAEIPGEEYSSLKHELTSRECNFLDFEIKIPEFNSLLKAKLRPLEWKAYTYLFIDHLSDIQTAKQLGYDTTGGKSSGGYKNILKIKTKIYKVSVEIVKDMEF